MRPVARRVRVEPVAELELAAEQPVVLPAGLQVARPARACSAAARPAPRCRRTRRARPRGRSWPRRPSRPGRARTGRRRGRSAPRSAPRRPRSGRWARSTSQLSQKARESNSVHAVGANACASPVQPSRSSRCGQSVGTATKLSRWDQLHVLVEPGQRRVGAVERAPRRGVAADREDLGRDQLGAGSHLGVPEAVEGERRLQHGLAVVGQHVRVGRLGRAQRAGVQAAVRLQHLGVPHGHGVAGPAADGEPDDTGDVLAGVEAHGAAGRDRALGPEGLPPPGPAGPPGAAGSPGRAGRPRPAPSRSRRTRAGPSPAGGAAGRPRSRRTGRRSGPRRSRRARSRRCRR